MKAVSLGSRFVLAAAFAGLFVICGGPWGLVWSADNSDVVSAVIESSRFKGKSPLEKLLAAAEILKSARVKTVDWALPLLDWADQYTREPAGPVDRLKRWLELAEDERLGHLRIPRDFLNRVLLAEYLIAHTAYPQFGPAKKLELLGRLEQERLIDWSVALAYARIYAGTVILGAEDTPTVPPLEALGKLKELTEKQLVSWHYTVPSEGVLAAEALAVDKAYSNGSDVDKLRRLEALEKEGLVSFLTRKEFERLPAWRLLVGDGGFLKASQAQRRDRIMKLKSDNLITPSTAGELMAAFAPSFPPPPDPKAKRGRPQRPPPRGLHATPD
jgi:hypothetical protein